MPDVELTVDGGVATLELARPERRNALSRDARDPASQHASSTGGR